MRVSASSAWRADSVRFRPTSCGRQKSTCGLHFRALRQTLRRIPIAGSVRSALPTTPYFLRRAGSVKMVETSAQSAMKGIRYALTARRWALWRKVVAEMEAKKMKPVNWAYLWALTGTAQYVLLR